ncbi:hypothetical protein, partial [Nocardia farcinica]
MNLVERTSGRTLTALLLVTGLTGCGQVSDPEAARTEAPAATLSSPVTASPAPPVATTPPVLRPTALPNRESCSSRTTCSAVASNSQILWIGSRQATSDTGVSGEGSGVMSTGR